MVANSKWLVPSLFLSLIRQPAIYSPSLSSLLFGLVSTPGGSCLRVSHSETAIGKDSTRPDSDCETDITCSLTNRPKPRRIKKSLQTLLTQDGHLQSPANTRKIPMLTFVTLHQLPES